MSCEADHDEPGEQPFSGRTIIEAIIGFCLVLFALLGLSFGFL